MYYKHGRCCRGLNTACSWGLLIYASRRLIHMIPPYPDNIIVHQRIVNLPPSICPKYPPQIPFLTTQIPSCLGILADYTPIWLISTRLQLLSTSTLNIRLGTAIDGSTSDPFAGSLLPRSGHATHLPTPCPSLLLATSPPLHFFTRSWFSRCCLRSDHGITYYQKIMRIDASAPRDALHTTLLSLLRAHAEITSIEAQPIPVSIPAVSLYLLSANQRLD